MRAANAKHLQFVSGVNFVTYWLATAIIDFFMYLVPFLLTILCLKVGRGSVGGRSEGRRVKVRGEGLRRGGDDG